MLTVCLQILVSVCWYVCLFDLSLCASSAAILSLPVSLHAGDMVCLPVLASYSFTCSLFGYKDFRGHEDFRDCWD